MTPADIDLVVTAKQQIRRILVLQLSVLTLIAIGIVLAIVIGGWQSVAARSLLYGLILGAPWLFMAARADKIRDRLLDALERQIHRDPEALRYLADARPPR